MEQQERAAAKAAARAKLAKMFAELPDEAFGFVSGTIMNIAQTAGGFQHDSRAALEAMGKEVSKYFDLSQ